jgi:serine/threonine protein kinase
LRAAEEDPSNLDNNPISEIKEKFENLIVSWKKAMEKTEFIVKYVNHWYDDVKNDIYILMEYCPGGDLRDEILKRKNQNKKITEEVCFYYLLIFKYYFVLFLPFYVSFIYILFI